MKTITAKEKRLQFVTVEIRDTNIPYYCLTSIAISFGFLCITKCIYITNVQSVKVLENPSFLWSLLEKYHHATISLE